MSLYKEFSENLIEMNIADLIQGIKAAQGGSGGCGCGESCGCNKGPIQADSNIGEFGAPPNVEQVQISKTEDGSIKITTDSICVKLHKPVIKCLKKFIQIMENEENG